MVLAISFSKRHVKYQPKKFNFRTKKNYLCGNHKNNTIMKKLLFSASLALCTVLGVNAQSTNFEAGAYAAFPVGDASDFSSFNLGVTAAYYWDVVDNLKIGALVGYDLFLAKKYDYGWGKVKGDDLGFVPIAASAKYDFNNFFAGVNLGYSISTTSGVDGGFLYQPRFGYSGTSFDVFGFYKGITSKHTIHTNFGRYKSSWTMSSIGAGFAYKF